MIEMDFNGITWVGNVYQKFEAMCLEVEEVIYEDTIKYVENQVQTVGASVKKLYSEVMQDVLPLSSIDPVKVAAGDLSLNPYADFSIQKKPKPNTKKETMISNKPGFENSIVKAEAKEICTKDLLPKQNRVMAFDSVASSIKSTADMILPLESVAKKEKQLTDISAQALPDVSLAEINGAGNEEVDSLMESYFSCDPKNHESACEDSVAPTCDYNVDFIECNNKGEPRPETTQEFDESNCVVVGREDLSVSAPREDKPRSYKKKIQRAFLSKKLVRKQEYKQLAVQHRCLGTGPNQEVSDNLSRKVLNEEKSPHHRISESEWELL